MPRGRPEIRELRNYGNRRFSNDSTPRQFTIRGTPSVGRASGPRSRYTGRPHRHKLRCSASPDATTNSEIFPGSGPGGEAPQLWSGRLSVEAESRANERVSDGNKRREPRRSGRGGTHAEAPATSSVALLRDRATVAGRASNSIVTCSPYSTDSTCALS